MLAAITIAGVLIGGAAAAMSLGPAKHTSVQAAESSKPSPSPSPEPTRPAEKRASRGELRAMPSSTPSKTKTPTPPPSGGTVTGTGTCQASYYGTGTTTANGEKFDPNGYTAANKTLPFNTRVRVTNKANGKSVVVRINDRGPFVAGRCLDLTPVAFKAIASIGSGVVTVTYQILA